MATHSSVLAWRIPWMGGAWWGTVYGVAQSRTRLKRLSSSSREERPGQVCLQIAVEGGLKVGPGFQSSHPQALLTCGM